VDEQVLVELKGICERLSCIEQQLKCLNKAVFEDSKNNLVLRVRMLEQKMIGVCVVVAICVSGSAVLKLF